MGGERSGGGLLNLKKNLFLDRISILMAGGAAPFPQRHKRIDWGPKFDLLIALF